MVLSKKFDSFLTMNGTIKKLDEKDKRAGKHKSHIGINSWDTSSYLTWYHQSKNNNKTFKCMFFDFPQHWVAVIKTIQRATLRNCFVFSFSFLCLAFYLLSYCFGIWCDACVFGIWYGAWVLSVWCGVWALGIECGVWVLSIWRGGFSSVFPTQFMMLYMYISVA